MDEHEKNDLIMRQRQEIARLTIELARVNKLLSPAPAVSDEVQDELPSGYDLSYRASKTGRSESKTKG